MTNAHRNPRFARCVADAIRRSHAYVRNDPGLIAAIRRQAHRESGNRFYGINGYGDPWVIEVVDVDAMCACLPDDVTHLLPAPYRFLDRAGAVARIKEGNDELAQIALRVWLGGSP